MRFSLLFQAGTNKHKHVNTESHINTYKNDYTYAGMCSQALDLFVLFYIWFCLCLCLCLCGEQALSNESRGLTCEPLMTTIWSFFCLPLHLETTLN